MIPLKSVLCQSFFCLQVVTNCILNGNLDLLEGWTEFISVLTKRMEFKSKHECD